MNGRQTPKAWSPRRHVLRWFAFVGALVFSLGAPWTAHAYMNVAKTEANKAKTELRALQGLVNRRVGARRYATGKRYRRPSLTVRNGEFIRIASMSNFDRAHAHLEKALEQATRDYTRMRSQTSRRTKFPRENGFMEAIINHLTKSKRVFDDFESSARDPRAQRWDKEVWVGDIRAKLNTAHRELNSAKTGIDNLMKYYREIGEAKVDTNVAKVLLAVDTGSDDLRGGKDNVDLTIFYRDRGRVRSFVFRNVNRSKRWKDKSKSNVRLSLPRAVHVDDITSYRLTTSFRGGMGGDNWNVERLNLSLKSRGGISLAQRKSCFAPQRDAKRYRGKRVYRFTGKQKRYDVQCRKLR